jgi:hypothetical protein
VAVDDHVCNLRQDLVAIAKYLKDNIKPEHVFVAKGSTVEEVFEKVQGKLQELESLSASATFGILNELSEVIEITEFLGENQDLCDKFVEIVTEGFNVNLQRAVLLQEANRYFEREVI